MSQYDFILNETRKLALLLARLLGLKAEGSKEEYEQYFNAVLHDEYQTELAELLELSETDFRERIVKASYSPEKLNALSQMLYVFAEPFTADDATAILLKKVLILFTLLETEHHYESFDNLNKRKHIHRFLNINYDRI